MIDVLDRRAAGVRARADRRPSRRPARRSSTRRSGVTIEPGLVTCLVSARARRDGGDRSAAGPHVARRRGPPRRSSRSRSSRWTPSGDESSSASRSPCCSRASFARQLDPWGRAGSDAAILEALAVANAARRPRGASGRARRRGRRARRDRSRAGQRQRLVARSRAARRSGDPRPRRADERRRRAHRGAHRPRPACRAARTDDRRRDDEPARPRPGRPGRARGRTVSSSAVRDAPRAAARDATTTATPSRAGRANERRCCRSPTGPELRRHARRLARRHRAALAGVVALHGLAAAAGLVGPGAARAPRPVGRATGRRPRTSTRIAARARRVHRAPDGAHVVRAADVVRPLGADVRRAPRGLHAPRSSRCRSRRVERAGHGRPRLADDCRRRLARPHDPLCDPRDADRRRDDRAHGRRRRSG